MVDTTSPLLGLLLMGTGGDNNSWGINLNNNVITPIENAIAGITTIAGLTGGSLTLTAPQVLSATIILAGALTSDQTLVVPNSFKRWNIDNRCSGAFFVLVKTAAGAPINVPNGVCREVICVGSDSVRRLDAERVGELFYHAGANAPAGSLECNGATPLRASAVDLFNAIGTTWGVGNNLTTFTLPNAYDTGRFLRSRTAAVAVGTAQASQNKAHTHTGSGTTSGISQAHTHTGSGTTSGMSANASHSHTASTSAAVFSGSGSQQYYGGPLGLIAASVTVNATNTDHTHTYSFTTSGDSVDHTHTYSFTTSGGSADGAEARPESLVGILCIRY